MNTDKRRAEFIVAARELFETKGIAKTSIGDVTKRVGVTRSLFYHYFDDKQMLVDAVIDERVDDFVAHVTQWNRQYHKTRSRESLKEIVSLIKQYLMASNSFANVALHEQSEELRQRFTARSADRLARKYELQYGSSLQGGQPANEPTVPYPYETYYVLAVGLMNLVNRNPDIEDDIIIDLIVGGLNLNGLY